MKRFKIVKKEKPVEHHYKVLITVEEDGELIASNSGEARAESFPRALNFLDERVRDSWQLIRQMAHVAASKEKE
jgi:prophage tail gpP-like protein